MRQDKIEYGLLVESALRTVVRDVMARLMNGEVPPPHHFYITFRTNGGGVLIPDYLKARYPGEMTIVLQHQYWDLEVEEDHFAVTLSFNDRPERLVIPYEAIKVFADPGVEFGLQFTIEPEGSEESGDAANPLALPNRRGVTVSTSELETAATGADDGSASSVPSDSANGEAGEADSKSEDGAEIVSLDRFRKK